MSWPSYLWAAVWFFLPGGIGNAAPVLASRLPLLRNWKTPLDGGKSYRGQRLLGDNKTVRGLLAGVLLAVLTAGLQHAIKRPLHVPELSLGQALLAGGLMGFGALIGDAVESFFKRRRNVAPGDGWFPFDQLDYIFGGLLFSYPLARPSWLLMVAVLIAWFGLHLVTVYLGYLAGVREKPI